MWEAHRRSNYFGRTPFDEKTDRPRWWLIETLKDGTQKTFPLPMDPSEITAPVDDVVSEFFRWLPWEDVTPPFQGSLEEWPHRLTEGLSIARREWHALDTWQQWRRAKRT